MKKLVLGVALSLVGFSALNAADLKCDSKEAKIAFAAAEFSLKPQWINELKKKGSLSISDRVAGDFDISISDDGVYYGAEDEHHDYKNFKLVKDDTTKKEVICEATRNEDAVTKFTLKKDSKGNLTAKKIEQH